MNAGDALFTKAQQKVLGLFFSQPEKSFYLNEVVRLAAMGKGAISRELHKLVDAGLLVVEKRGNQSHYQANQNCPVFAEIASIVRKTFGIADQLRLALEPLALQIDAAFVFGSVASGKANAFSDIDVCVVGDAEFADVVSALFDVQDLLQREINPKCFSTTEWLSQKENPSAFFNELLHKDVINLIGDRNDIG